MNDYTNFQSKYQAITPINDALEMVKNRKQEIIVKSIDDPVFMNHYYVKKLFKDSEVIMPSSDEPYTIVID